MPVKTLGDVTTLIQQATALLPAMGAAYQQLYGVYKQAHPDATFEDFNAELLGDSLDVQAFSVGWLISHGYRKLPDGTWVKP